MDKLIIFGFILLSNLSWAQESKNQDKKAVIELINNIPIQSNHKGITTLIDDSKTYLPNLTTQKAFHEIKVQPDSTLIFKLYLYTDYGKAEWLSAIVEFEALSEWRRKSELEVVGVQFNLIEMLSESKDFKSTDKIGNRKVTYLGLNLIYDYETGLFLGNSLSFIWGNVTTEKADSVILEFWTRDGQNWNKGVSSSNYILKTKKRNEINN